MNSDKLFFAGFVNHSQSCFSCQFFEKYPTCKALEIKILNPKNTCCKMYLYENKDISEYLDLITKGEHLTSYGIRLGKQCQRKYINEPDYQRIHFAIRRYEVIGH